MQYPRLAILVSLGATLVAANARADTGSCTLSGSALACTTTIPCGDDATCFGSGGGHCMTPPGGSGYCARDCSALFKCSSDADCPVVPMLAGSCHAASISGVPGVCEYRDSVAARFFVTYCASGNVTLANVAMCLGMGDRWDTGDCDRDGLPNATDAMPCTADPTGQSLPPVRSPFCMHDHICEGTTSVCAPLLSCAAGTSECTAVAGHIGSTAPWECSAIPGTGMLPFCHPSCFATAHCTGSEPCDPRFGACTMATASLSMCLPMPIVTCESGCVSNPLDWASAQGDCDHDGAQNGCDPNPCQSGDAMCLFSHMCSIDAGVDAGRNGSDVGVVSRDAFAGIDAATSVDAAVSLDAAIGIDAPAGEDAFTGEDATMIENDAFVVGSDSGPSDGGRFDASGASIDVGTSVAPNTGFGGGGGCRCAIVGARRQSALVLLAGIVAIAVGKRRRRR